MAVIAIDIGDSPLGTVPNTDCPQYHMRVCNGWESVDLPTTAEIKRSIAKFRLLLLSHQQLLQNHRVEGFACRDLGRVS